MEVKSFNIKIAPKGVFQLEEPGQNLMISSQLLWYKL